MFEVESVEEKKSPWIIDYPINRLEYFRFIIFLILVLLLVKYISNILPVCKTAPILFTFILIVVYLNFIAMAKRIYHIIGEKKGAIVTTIIVHILSPIFHIISTLVLLILLFMPGNKNKT